MNIFSVAPSPFQIIYKNTVAEIKENIENSIDSENRMSDMTYKKSPDKTVLEIPNLVSFEHLVKKYYNRAIMDDDYRDTAFLVNIEEDGNAFNTYSEEFTESTFFDFIEMFTIKNDGKFFSYEEALDIALDVNRNGGDAIYGIVFKIGHKSYINPFHIVTAKRFKDFPEHFEKERVESILIYSFINNMVFDRKRYFHWYEKAMESMCDDIKHSYGIKMDEYKYDEEGFKIDIGYTLLNMFQISDITITRENINFIITDMLEYAITYDEVGIEKQTGKKFIISDPEHTFLVPNQIANISGIATPYYGITVAQNGRAWSITPNASCNISAPDHYHPAGFDISEGGGVCTHSGQPYTVDGISALNHSNFTSRLSSVAMGIGTIGFSMAMKDMAMELYSTELEEIQTIEPEEVKTKDGFIYEDGMTYLEFIDENPDATMRDFLRVSMTEEENNENDADVVVLETEDQQ